MQWIWIWMRASFPFVVAFCIVLEAVQGHTIWTILYRGALIGLAYGTALLALTMVLYARLRPQEEKKEKQQDAGERKAAEKPDTKQAGRQNAKAAAVR